MSTYNQVALFQVICVLSVVAWFLDHNPIWVCSGLASLIMVVIVPLWRD